MDPKIQAYIDANCHRHGRVKVRDLVRRLKGSLDPREARRYPRGTSSSNSSRNSPSAWTATACIG